MVNYIIQNNQSKIIINDTVGSKLVPDNFINKYSQSDTLIRIRNLESAYSNVTEAIDWMLLDVIETGKLKILEHGSDEFIDSIILNEVNTGVSGSKHILTTEGKNLFSKMTWIN